MFKIFKREKKGKDKITDSSDYETSSPMSEKAPERFHITGAKLSDFEVGKILGTGSFGRVLIGRHKVRGIVCALKMLSKAQMLKTKQVSHVMAEKRVLMKVNYPFLVKLYGTFQDPRSLFFILEYIVGGEFFTYLRTAGRLAEKTTKFYIGEIVLTFNYLHSRQIVYRDLKPENLLLDSRGHVRITDFGFAKFVDFRTYTLCGTPDYLAPEIILNKGHSFPVDWWALGVLIFEMLAGYPPFFDDEAMGTYRKILKGKFTYPSHFSRNARDLVSRLLQADLTKRYGNLKAGAEDIKKHPWFSEMDWDALENLQLKPTIMPKWKGEMDTSNFDDYSNIGEMEHVFELNALEQNLFDEF